MSDPAFQQQDLACGKLKINATGFLHDFFFFLYPKATFTNWLKKLFLTWPPYSKGWTPLTRFFYTRIVYFGWGWSILKKLPKLKVNYSYHILTIQIWPLYKHEKIAFVRLFSVNLERNFGSSFKSFNLIRTKTELFCYLMEKYFCQNLWSSSWRYS